MSVRKKRYTLRDFSTLSQRQIKTLEQNGFDTIEKLAEVPTLQLKTLLDTTPNKASLILKEARQNLPPFKIQTARMLLDSEKYRQYIPLGCKALDDLLGGKGIETGSITEFYAQFGSGKSQIAFTALVRAMLKPPHGLNGSVMIIDTEGTFSPSRILQIKSYYEQQLDHVSDEQFLQNIKVIQPLKSSEQVQIMKEFLEDEGLGYLNYMQMKKPLKLVVVDSVTNLFRSEYIGRGTLAERQQRLNEHIRDLYLFGLKNNVAIVVTNQVMANPDPFSAIGDVAVGGNIMAHASTYRIAIRKRKDYRIATMIDSSRLPVGEAVFKITRKGVLDVDDDSTETL